MLKFDSRQTFIFIIRAIIRAPFVCVREEHVRSANKAHIWRYFRWSGKEEEDERTERRDAD